ncbi:hypothetical protein HMPREF1076_01652 [Parabacteroides goldsteinii CL02T12C30]|uniref:TraD/TraG TraM recognition site domain-containing protein n=1 Tax=Parabacteroides goldsteinii CL02T12C30 TaxID=999418 RepID=K6ALA5_9BACT|nr:hypothetical protein HMPREF1076_01652 [Parabacteroides goldsteinii CL02T12C30]
MVNFRLIKLVESRIHREVYVRFGGEYLKIRHSNMKMDVGCLAYIQNTVGNVFSGQVVGETAKILSERFGKVLQKRQSMTINQREKSTSISTQMDSLIPASKISNLTQGMFVGAVADNFDERIEQKIFHCEIVVDNEKVKRETARYVKLPQIIDFTDKDGNDRMQEEIQANYDRIRQEVRQIVEDEITRIKNDPELCHLIKEEE